MGVTIRLIEANAFLPSGTRFHKLRDAVADRDGGGATWPAVLTCSPQANSSKVGNDVRKNWKSVVDVSSNW